MVRGSYWNRGGRGAGGRGASTDIYRISAPKKPLSTPVQNRTASNVGAGKVTAAPSTNEEQQREDISVSKPVRVGEGKNSTMVTGGAERGRVKSESGVMNRFKIRKIGEKGEMETGGTKSGSEVINRFKIRKIGEKRKMETVGTESGRVKTESEVINRFKIRNIGEKRKMETSGAGEREGVKTGGEVINRFKIRKIGKKSENMPQNRIASGRKKGGNGSREKKRVCVIGGKR